MRKVLKKQKRNIHMAAWFLLLFLAAMVLILACRGSNQAAMSFLLPYHLQGEYRLGEGSWTELQEDTDLSALKGDLYLRGYFDREVPEGMLLNFYLDHIAMSMSVNGEMVFITSTMETDTGADLCGTFWNAWYSSGIKENDLVEIHLQNKHRFGNKNAYKEFLAAFYACDTERLEDLVWKYSRPYWTVGFFIIVVSILLLGMAFGFRMLHIPQHNLLFHLGLFSFFTGGYILLDNPDISLKIDLIVFHTYGRQLCIMMAGLELGICILGNLKGKSRKITAAATGLMGLTDGILLLTVLVGKVNLYDTIPVWVAVHSWICIAFAGICVFEYKKGSKENRLIMFSFFLMLMAVMLEFINYFVYWWASGLLVKNVFFILIIFNLVKAVITVSRNYQYSIQVKQMEEELKNSRIVLAMSQIRSHFMFNVLNAISCLCKYDSEKADEMVVCFARYLRVNIDVLKEDRPVPFWRILEQLEDYVMLEQLRFEDRLQFVKKIEADDFDLPYLTIQPIIENSIKHGLLPKKEGGTIELHTQREGENILISVTDNGVGYNMEEMDRDHSVGLENVRFRLKYMMHGRMTIESKPGEGTKVTIIIPDDSQRRDRT